jgi:phenylalanyl-tRNA synthetase alpha chain
MTTPDVTELQSALLAEVMAADSLEALEAVRVSALGRKGRITEQMKGLGKLDGDARKAAGQELNQVKDAVAAAISARQLDLEAVALEARIAGETLDVTLPVRLRPNGRIHPVSQAMEECIAIFGEMGFAVAEGPDVEDDFHNFTALNIPPEHPARQMHDTFYLPERDDGSRLLLRTHTSPVQIRTMERTKPPIRVIAPGRTYRSDSDATHTPMFHQIEALVVDETTHMGHLISAAPSSASPTCRSASGRATSRSPNRRWRSTSAARVPVASSKSVISARAPTTGSRLWAPAWSTPRFSNTVALTRPSIRASRSAWGSTALPC